MDLSIEIRGLTSKEDPGAVRILARGMRDNPLHLRAFDADAERRARFLELMFGAVSCHAPGKGRGTLGAGAG